MDNQSKIKRLRRRDFIKLSVAGVGTLALIKIAGRSIVGVKAPKLAIDAEKLKHLSERRAAIVIAAATAICGPGGLQSYEQGLWEPASDVDDFIDRLHEDQRGLIGLLIDLLEEWTLGFTGFSGLHYQDRIDYLARWRTSGNPLKQAAWSFLHVASTFSFSSCRAGWGVMKYPGPCLAVAEENYLGRNPGQSATYVWDESVP